MGHLASGVAGKDSGGRHNAENCHSGIIRQSGKVKINAKTAHSFLPSDLGERLSAGRGTEGEAEQQVSVDGQRRPRKRLEGNLHTKWNGKLIAPLTGRRTAPLRPRWASPLH